VTSDVLVLTMLTVIVRTMIMNIVALAVTTITTTGDVDEGLFRQ
jgi:hypothetical protein